MASQCLGEAVARAHFVRLAIPRKGLAHVVRRIDGTAVTGHGIGAEERDVGLKQQDGLHASVGEEGVAVVAAHDVDDLTQACLVLLRYRLPLSGAVLRHGAGWGKGRVAGMAAEILVVQRWARGRRRWGCEGGPMARVVRMGMRMGMAVGKGGRMRDRVVRPWRRLVVHHFWAPLHKGIDVEGTSVRA